MTTVVSDLVHAYCLAFLRSGSDISFHGNHLSACPSNNLFQVITDYVTIEMELTIRGCTQKYRASTSMMLPNEKWIHMIFWSTDTLASLAAL